jgi:very-short-patch-repair endonuclease
MNFKRNRTYEEKLIDALDNNIKNIEPSKRENILQEMKTNLVSENVIKIRKYIVEKYFGSLPENGANTAIYWIARGWEEYTAKRKSSEFLAKKGKRKSPFQVSFWLEKENPNTGKKFTEQEAEYKVRSQRPINSEYWIEKGYSEEESIKLALDKKDSNNKSGAKASRNRSGLSIRKSSKRCAEYWIERGKTKEEAIEEVKKSQSTFSLEKCILKFGEEEGTKKWQKRQDKWIKTLNSKPQEEKDRINRSKVAFGGISKAEKFIMSKIIDIIPELQVQYNIGNYICDFVLNKNAVEYFGDYWHCNPKKYKPKFINKVSGLSAEEIWEKDKKRIKVYEENGFTVKIIWEDDFKKNPEKIILDILSFLKS